jgi:hypothetical protein
VARVASAVAKAGATIKMAAMERLVGRISMAVWLHQVAKCTPATLSNLLTLFQYIITWAATITKA